MATTVFLWIVALSIWNEGFMDWVESAEAIGQVDDILASVGLGHGRR